MDMDRASCVDYTTADTAAVGGLLESRDGDDSSVVLSKPR